MTCRVKQRIKKKEEQIAKAALAAKVKEDLKTVALGTSKINYLDPRISVAWCKRNEVRAAGGTPSFFTPSDYGPCASLLGKAPGFC